MIPKQYTIGSQILLEAGTNSFTDINKTINPATFLILSLGILTFLRESDYIILLLFTSSVDVLCNMWSCSIFLSRAFQGDRLTSGYTVQEAYGRDEVQIIKIYFTNYFITYNNTGQHATHSAVESIANWQLCVARQWHWLLPIKKQWVNNEFTNDSQTYLWEIKKIYI